MTPADWMDDLLDRHPGEPVPPGFHERLKARLADEPATQGPVLRPGFRRLLPMAAAAIVFLGIGFWLGRAGDPLGEDPGRPSEETVSIEEIDLENLDLLQSWDLVLDESLELGWVQAESDPLMEGLEEEGE